MKDKLPSVYSNPIEKSINNNKEYYYADVNDTNLRSPKDVSKIANQIFASKDFVYKKKVIITTFDNEYVTYLVGRTNTSLLTMDGLNIPIVNITNLEIME